MDRKVVVLSPGCGPLPMPREQLQQVSRWVIVSERKGRILYLLLVLWL